MYGCKDGFCPVHKVPRCCVHCEEIEHCIEKCANCSLETCDLVEELPSDMISFNNQYLAVMQDIAAVVAQKKAAEEQEKRLKDALKEAMEAYGVKSVDNDILKITYIAPTVAVSVDTAKLKKKYPEIAEECSKSASKAGYIKVEVKEGVNGEAKV